MKDPVDNEILAKQTIAGTRYQLWLVNRLPEFFELIQDFTH